MKSKTTQLLVEYKPSACLGFTIKIPNAHAASSAYCRRLAVAEDLQFDNVIKEDDKVYYKQRLRSAVG